MTDPPPPPIPERPTLARMRAAVQGCRACDLYAGATQGVMGEGSRHASMALVGEQPGDREDIEGHPFVGPAGRVLHRGLQRAGISPADAYLTNVVKHFRYETRGKRRIHQKPSRWQIVACLPWLHAELEIVRPRALVLLGATASQALLGPHVRVSRDRGRPMDSDLADLVMVTNHPSAILRARDHAGREEAMERFVADLNAAVRWLREHGDGRRR